MTDSDHLRTALRRIANLGEKNVAEHAQKIAFEALAVPAIPNRAATVPSVDAEREAIANEARRYASHYPPHSDGQNTFILFAEWIEKRAGKSPENVPKCKRCNDTGWLEPIGPKEDGSYITSRPCSCSR